MGLLEKSLKKAGKTRDEKPAAAGVQSGERKQPVGWLRTSLGERTSALADKIDLEEQYAKLESLAEKAPPPPKPSLRDRARKILGGMLVPAAGETKAASPPAKTKTTLRQRAAELLKRFGGGGGVGGAGQGESPSESGASVRQETRSTSGDQSTLPASELDDGELPEPVFFPWFALSEDGALKSQVSFGEAPAEGEVEEEKKEQPAVAAAEAKSGAQAPLADFADTISRITENLKNLHTQLDKGSFIRSIQVEQKAQALSPTGQPLISHHVALGDTPPAPKAMPAEAKDVFWPRQLPLDLPARDIRINADGSIAVVPGPFQLPYLAEDIAPPDSELSHFTRNLKNAELFIAEGELQLVRIIYERLLKQIVDEEARRKIKANLEALDKYRKAHDWGSFLPVPPWLRNPWQDFKPPQLSVSEMPVEAKSITINIDKGFFDMARAAFAQEKAQTKEIAPTQQEVGHEGEIGSEEKAEEAQAERRSQKDRRQGLPDPRGENAVERRSGRDRRADAGAGAMPAEENAAPPPLDAAGEAAAKEPLPDGVMEEPQIPQMAPDGTAQPQAGGAAGGEEGGDESGKEADKVQEIRGVLELKTPDQEDTPFLTLTYDFTKIPHAYRLAKDNGIFEYAYYKYKPMLVKAHQFIKRKQITRALNYYRVIREQQIPAEFRHMVDRNIKDITEYLQKYLVTRQN